MKNLIVVATAILSLAAFAHEIEGTLVLNGSLKTKITVNGMKGTCKVKIVKVKNLLEEDSFGNPAYTVRIGVNVEAGPKRGGIELDKEFNLNNLFKVGEGSEVRDLEYASAEGVTMKIDSEGRLDTVVIPHGGHTITCAF